MINNLPALNVFRLSISIQRYWMSVNNTNDSYKFKYESFLNPYNNAQHTHTHAIGTNM